MLVSGLVTVVDVLAVAPGFGGQKFQPKTSAKIKLLSKLKDGGMVPSFEIMVDGTYVFGCRNNCTSDGY